MTPKMIPQQKYGKMPRHINIFEDDTTQLGLFLRLIIPYYE